MRTFWTGVALVAALAVQTALGQLLPAHARLFDPFLLVLVYCGLTGGDRHGMLAGAAAGWVQDVHFGGRVVGISGLTKLLVGYAVGWGGTRFHLGEPPTRAGVLFVATVVDALAFAQLSALFDVPVLPLSLGGLLARASLDALLGLAVYEVLERRVRGRTRP